MKTTLLVGRVVGLPSFKLTSPPCVCQHTGTNIYGHDLKYKSHFIVGTVSAFLFYMNAKHGMLLSQGWFLLRVASTITYLMLYILWELKKAHFH